MDTQPQKPDFIVDAQGHVRDVRKLDPSQISALLTAMEAAGPSPQGSPSGTTAQRASTASNRQYYIIPIPIGLLITIILLVVSNTRPNRASTAFNEGLALMNLDAYDEAIASFDEAIRLKSDFCAAYDHRGLAYHALSVFDQAFTDYDQSIACYAKVERAPGASDPAAPAYNNRGTAHFQAGNYEQAISDFTTAIEGRKNYEGERDFGKAFHNRGLVYLAMGNHHQAIADFEQALKYSMEFSMPSRPEDAPESDFIARMEEERERSLEQQRDVTFQAGKAEVYVSLGKTHFDMGLDTEAISDFSRAIDLQPASATLAEAHTMRGIAYYDSGDDDQALRDFDDAVRLLSARLAPSPTSGLRFLTPGPSDAYLFRASAENQADLALPLYFRGLVFLARGEPGLAVADLEQSLSLNAGDDWRQEVEPYLDLARAYFQDSGMTATDTSNGPEDDADPDAR